jgi:hypothetical protein
MSVPITDQELDSWLALFAPGEAPKWSRETTRKYSQDDRAAHERAQARKAANAPSGVPSGPPTRRGFEVLST